MASNGSIDRVSALLKLAYLFFFFGLAERDETLDARGVEEVIEAVKAEAVIGSRSTTTAAAASAAVKW
eukprot:scaffold15415_cov66-Skeletonema_marinoi.AAC.1